MKNEAANMFIMGAVVGFPIGMVLGAALTAIWKRG